MLTLALIDECRLGVECKIESRQKRLIYVVWYAEKKATGSCCNFFVANFPVSVIDEMLCAKCLYLFVS